MSFNDFLADLDATVFAELSDDPAAIWFRMEGVAYTVAAILEGGERGTSAGGMPTMMAGVTVRLSAAEIAAKAPDPSGLEPPQIAALIPQFANIWPAPPPRPMAGERITINGRHFIFHGDPWLDEEQGSRDWICPVTRA